MNISTAPGLAQVSRCRCSGNCGSGSCERRLNLRRDGGTCEHICTTPVQAGHTLCARCECEAHGCNRPRNSKVAACAKRFCTLCAKNVPLVACGQGYITAFGKQRFDKGWSSVLTLMASWGFLLNFVMPTDCTAFRAYALELGARPGANMSAPVLTLLFLANAVKWPTVVDFMKSRTEHLVDVSAAGIVRILVEAVKFADSKSWPTMFYRMNSGLGNATTGLVIALRQMHLLVDDDATDGQKKRKRAALNDGEVRLGPAGSVYKTVADTEVARQIVEKILERAASCPPWPADTSEVAAFATHLKAFARACRSDRVKAGGSSYGLFGGENPKHQYSVRHFCRVMLFVVEGLLGPDCWDSWRMEDLLAFCPDESAHAEGMEAWTGLDIRKSFNISPLFFTCWACLIDDIPEAQRQAARRLPHHNLWRVLRDFERKSDLQGEDEEDPVFAPGPRILQYEASRL